MKNWTTKRLDRELEDLYTKHSVGLMSTAKLVRIDIFKKLQKKKNDR